MGLEPLVDEERYPLASLCFRKRCRSRLELDGMLVMPNFITSNAILLLQREGESRRHLAYYAINNHNVYLAPVDPDFPLHHVRNREVRSSKGCITTDQIPHDSSLHQLYTSPDFRSFLCTILGEDSLYEYADPLSSINLHYASEGQELGWHYDNSSFAITLMIQSPKGGGVFEYVKNVRDARRDEMNYERSQRVIDGIEPAQALSMQPGTLVVFRGRNSMHRVTPVRGNSTRMLVVFAYNTEPDISLSETARMIFYGRLG